MTRRWRSEVHTLLEGGETRSRATSAAELTLVGTIVVSVAGVTLETVDSIAALYGGLLVVIRQVAMVVLTVEYGLRLWAAPEREPGVASGSWRPRLRYALSPLGLIDLLAILPFYLVTLVSMGPDWLRVLRLLALFKLARYAPALPLFAAVIRNESRPLLAALMVMGVLLIFNSAVMYVLERGAQPTAFASIPHAMWWAIVTMATVGYGDVVPVTPLGRVFGGFVMVLGIAMFAVPAGILATGFAVELRKRDFVVTWQTVAKVPLFVGLDAARIAEIARLLKREIVPAKYAVVRRGEPADAMFFIMAGEVEVDVQPAPRRMGPGQFFGEIALLHDTVRTATVTTVSECELLCLEVADFRRLLDAHPDVRAAITRVAEQRLAALAGSPPGDAAGRAPTTGG
jgi:voltage-gated potassium channel